MIMDGLQRMPSFATCEHNGLHDYTAAVGDWAYALTTKTLYVPDISEIDFGTNGHRRRPIIRRMSAMGVSGSHVCACM